MFDTFATPCTVVCQAPLSIGFPRQEYWSGLPFPSLGDLPHPGMEPTSPTSQADSLPLHHPGSRPCYVNSQVSIPISGPEPQPAFFIRLPSPMPSTCWTYFPNLRFDLHPLDLSIAARLRNPLSQAIRISAGPAMQTRELCWPP